MNSDEFRCSVSSRDDGEPLAGTAPTDTTFLFVEDVGPWGRNAVEESRLPEAVREHLGGFADTRVQLIRRHAGTGDAGTRIFHATATTGDAGERGFDVRTAVLDTPDQLLDLEHDALAPYDEPLWFVCTNGRRDRCCAEAGRPIAAALTARWPGQTWETTHLGGHRFAGTLLALPSGHTLGRLDPRSAVAACARIEAGEVPVDLSRGRAGTAPEEQVLELHRLAGGADDVDVVEVAWPPRRQSCADLREKPTVRFEVRARA